MKKIIHQGQRYTILIDSLDVRILEVVSSRDSYLEKIQQAVLSPPKTILPRLKKLAKMNLIARSEVRKNRRFYYSLILEPSQLAFLKQLEKSLH